MHPEHILSFWFGPIADDGSCAPEAVRRWWAKDPAFDREVSDTFGAAIAAAERGELDAWRDSADGCLALVVLCDQMTRNSRRDTARMYAADELALDVAGHAIEQGFDAQLRTMQRYVLYMPFMHAESRELQREGIALFERLAATAEPGAKPAADAALDYMRRHEAIVARFGRFPHRNALLGRASTAEEQAFLAEPGSSF